MTAGFGLLLMFLGAVCFAGGRWFSMLGRSRHDDPISLLQLQRGWRIGGRISIWAGCAFIAAGIVVLIASFFS